MFNLTTKAKRINQAIAEIESVLNSAMKYSVDFQDTKLITEYREQLVRLQGMLLNEILAA